MPDHPEHGWMRVSIKLPFVDGVMTTEVQFAPGEAELFFKPRKRGANETQREREEYIEERRWRITQIASNMAASMLSEIEKVAKK